MKTKRIGLVVLLMSTLAIPVALPWDLHVARASTAQAADADAPTADTILAKASEALFPDQFTAKIQMTAVKPGAPNNVSELMLYKRGSDLVRSDYVAPAVQAGQKILRKDGQIWMYMPDTKRAIKLSPKQSLGGSDFNNGDIMRLNLVEDYTPTIIDEDADKWVLELKARSKSTPYDMIKFTIEKNGYKSVRQEFYTLSGKQIKSLEFSDYKNYNGLLRPSLFVMKSLLAEGVYTNMRYLQFEPNTTLPEAAFRQDALSRQ